MTETIRRYTRGDAAALLVPHLRVGERTRPLAGSDGGTCPVAFAQTACGLDIYYDLAGKLSTTDREATRCRECYDASAEAFEHHTKGDHA